MDRFQLAQLVEWAGTLKTRKRLQKVVYLLQSAGCPLKADFTLHHFGPYSFEVARLVDEMVRADLLEEEEGFNPAGREYSYTLKPRAKAHLKTRRDLRRTKGDATSSNDETFNHFRSRAKVLLDEPDVRKLEYAATIAYFRKQCQGWEAALERAAQFKKKPANSEMMRDALKLAKDYTT